MGRATQFFHFINQETLDKDDEVLYTHLSITDEIRELRKKNLLTNKVIEKELKAKDDGTFSLF